MLHCVADTIVSAPVLTVVNNGMTSFTIDGATNPTLYLVRGKTYTFNVTSVNHPFWIKTVQGNGNQNGYAYGLSANGVQSGTIVFTVPALAPDTLYYNCEFHPVMTGVISISGGLLVLEALSSNRLICPSFRNTEEIDLFERLFFAFDPSS